MGTGPFAVPSFEAIRASGHDEIAFVVTRPSKPDSKGKPALNPVREWAESHGLEVLAPASINESESTDRLRKASADLMVVCDYGQILSMEAIAAARFGGINLHGSLLPRHRGAAPVQWSVLLGDRVTGSCVIHLTPKLDAGPILTRVETEIGTHENAAELESRLSEIGVACTLEALSIIRDCRSMEEVTARGAIQDSNAASKAPRLTKSDGQLDFRFPAELIDRQIRGLQPWPGTFGILELDKGKELRVAISRAWLIQSEPENPSPGALRWGGALPDAARGSDLAVECAKGWLAIESLQPAGKRVVTAKEFLAGYGRLREMRFQSPESSERSLLSRLLRNDRL
jgi:methionyl-tRNA formyltransferase